MCEHFTLEMRLCGPCSQNLIGIRSLNIKYIAAEDLKKIVYCRTVPTILQELEVILICIGIIIADEKNMFEDGTEVHKQSV